MPATEGDPFLQPGSRPRSHFSGSSTTEGLREAVRALGECLLQAGPYAGLFGLGSTLLVSATPYGASTILARVFYRQTLVALIPFSAFFVAQQVLSVPLSDGLDSGSLKSPRLAVGFGEFPPPGTPAPDPLPADERIYFSRLQLLRHDLHHRFSSILLSPHYNAAANATAMGLCFGLLAHLQQASRSRQALAVQAGLAGGLLLTYTSYHLHERERQAERRQLAEQEALERQAAEHDLGLTPVAPVPNKPNAFGDLYTDQDITSPLPLDRFFWLPVRFESRDKPTLNLESRDPLDRAPILMAEIFQHSRDGSLLELEPIFPATRKRIRAANQALADLRAEILALDPSIAGLVAEEIAAAEAVAEAAATAAAEPAAEASS
ncbi:hypothetical protein H696_00727 [Fonticula alba]|uniref:Uncharacterized protein n=1 Tax=Fonticula alba TaxID=691883 RepID=A0A058ZFQ1_FONAL|nr:hypothetical protein H696_00727 [Fonticula alba]KCV73184.1 hypothetical protein H696_00727 [Fonticula alba]|eukprot:XP_009492885.1 hypothetical protein H696_00727 [Fonticula alba]